MSRFFTSLILLIFLCAVPFANNAQGVKQLWGTTAFGGPTNTGTIYSLDMNGQKFTNRYNFEVQNNGYGNGETKLAEYNGKFYGTTFYGGIHGDGVLFEWDPVANIYITKVDFNRDLGEQPGNLLLYNGKLYGTAGSAGTNLGGVLFEYDPATNTYTKIYDFGFINGAFPTRNLSLKDGKLYGSTFSGGINGSGVIFEFDPATSVYTKKYDLNINTGMGILGGFTLVSNKFYGLAFIGGNPSTGGVLFEWDPATNIYIVKYQFVYNSVTGFTPQGSVTALGTKLYGMTQYGGSFVGGSFLGNGVIFEYDLVGNAYTKIFEFNSTSGMNPVGDLLLNSGKFYGVASTGGANNDGTLFEYDPAIPQFTKKIDMAAATGSIPRGSLLLSNGKMYGMSAWGGADYSGTLFEWEPASNIYTKKIDLSLNNGMFPTLSFAHKNGKLHGITSAGGAGLYGTLYEFNPYNSQITSQVEMGTINGAVPIFNSSTGPVNGNYPSATLVEKNGKYYGMTLEGGANNKGTIFEWDPATSVFTKRLDIAAITQNTAPVDLGFIPPFSCFVPYNDKFVGIINNSGIDRIGAIFEWDPATNNFTLLKDFTLAGGAIPFPSLDSFNGKFYGTTHRGGANNEGTIYEWDPATNTYTKKIDFNVGSEGSRPLSGMVLLNNKFYGVTYSGGLNDKGVMFEYDPIGNTYSKKEDAAVAYFGIGKPFGRLVKNGNRLYGLAAEGGDNDLGAVYEWRPLVDSFIVNHSFNGSDGRILFEEDILGFNELAIIPAPISKGTPGSCVTYASEQIHTPNHFAWVPLTDANGDVIAEINANGQDLGVVNYSININTGPLREDIGQRLYLDRNFIITPQVQPTSRVDLRFYITAEEYQRLQNADDAKDDPFDQLDDVNDLRIVESHSNICTNALQQTYTGLPIVSITPYENGYVIHTFVFSFSTIYIANFDYILLPVDLLFFSGKTLGDDAELSWKTANESNLKGYILERSLNGKDFVTAGTVNAINYPSGGEYRFLDKQIRLPGVTRLYYRLRSEDIDGKSSYSRVIVLTVNEKGNVAMIYPNPVRKELGLMVSFQRSQQVKWNITDNSGRIVKQGSLFISAGSNNTNLDISSLARGVYYLSLDGEQVMERLKFVKE